MPAAVKLREDFSAQELRALARRAKDVNQSRRLLSLAAVRDGMDRAGGGEDRRHGSPDAARLGSSLQRFGAGGPHQQLEEGPKPRLSEEQLAQFVKIVEAGPARTPSSSRLFGDSVVPRL